MPKIKRENFTDQEIIDLYKSSRDMTEAARRLGVSYPTASKWVAEVNASRRQGYNAPKLPITGLQCRHAREYLGQTRDQFCDNAGISKTALREFELGKRQMRETTMAKVMVVFDRYGVCFLDDGTFRVSG